MSTITLAHPLPPADFSCPEGLRPAFLSLVYDVEQVVTNSEGTVLARLFTPGREPRG